MMKDILEYSLTFFFIGIFITIIWRFFLLLKVERDKFSEIFAPFGEAQIWLLGNLLFPTSLPKLVENDKAKLIRRLNILKTAYWIIWLQFLVIVAIGFIHKYYFTPQ